MLSCCRGEGFKPNQSQNSISPNVSRCVPANNPLNVVLLCGAGLGLRRAHDPAANVDQCWPVLARVGQCRQIWIIQVQRAPASGRCSPHCLPHCLPRWRLACQRHFHEVCHGRDLKLFHDVGAVRLDRFDADAQIIGNLLVQPACHDAFKHLLLTGG
jgi:hypothetical protein